MDDLTRRRLLGEFLRTRRGQLNPEDYGFATSSRRRTTGLRREEVAALGNLGLAWYTALEQAKDIHPSPGILASLARVFRFSPDETRHLFFLAGQFFDEERSASGKAGDEVPDTMALILSSLSPLPAYVLDSCWNYSAWNQEAGELFSLHKPGANLVREFFLNPSKRQLYADWDSVARHIVSEYRADIEGQGNPQAALQVVEGVKQESDLFGRLWDAYPVLGTQDRLKSLVSPTGGPQKFAYTTFRLAAQETMKLVVYTPAE